MSLKITDSGSIGTSLESSITTKKDSGSSGTSLESLIATKIDLGSGGASLESSIVTKIDLGSIGTSLKSTQKTFGTSKDTWQKFGNPKKARIIFIGDIHTKDQDKERGDIINKYGGKGKDTDIVLLEGEQECDTVPQSSGRFDTQRKVKCYGWDIVKSVEESVSLISTIFALKDKYGEEDPSSKWSPEDVRTWDESWDKYYEHFDLRTESLIKTVKIALEDLKPGQRIFVIAGSDHLYLERTGFNILDHFEGYKIAMLLPEESPEELRLATSDTNNYVKAQLLA